MEKHTSEELKIRATKICKACNIEKNLTEFYKHPSTKDRRRGMCALCMLAKNRVKYESTPEYWTMKGDHHYRTKYGITIEDYNDMFIEQAGLCGICGNHQKDLKKKLAVDHCHKTGKVRGLLCHHCNTALGNFRDRIALLKNAVKYLENGIE